MSPRNVPIALFRLGHIVATPNALEHITPAEIDAALARHLAADWGDLSEQDKHENQFSLEKGFRLFSVYHAKNGTKFYIITEADRSATTVLLPEDY